MWICPKCTRILRDTEVFCSTCFRDANGTETRLSGVSDDLLENKTLSTGDSDLPPEIRKALPEELRKPDKETCIPEVRRLLSVAKWVTGMTIAAIVSLVIVFFTTPGIYRRSTIVITALGSVFYLFVTRTLLHAFARGLQEKVESRRLLQRMLAVQEKRLEKESEKG